ncbi:hypothetical protein BDW22DRAFT_90584 [Trametopsis cervina]|nr:hypothetical protein BDW22DRAFT_90584 [Trametopsis cervina]
MIIVIIVMVCQSVIALPATYEHHQYPPMHIPTIRPLYHSPPTVVIPDIRDLYRSLPVPPSTAGLSTPMQMQLHRRKTTIRAPHFVCSRLRDRSPSVFPLYPSVKKVSKPSADVGTPSFTLVSGLRRRVYTTSSLARSPRSSHLIQSSLDC